MREIVEPTSKQLQVYGNLKKPIDFNTYREYMRHVIDNVDIFMTSDQKIRTNINHQILSSTNALRHQQHRMKK